jgi:hypothetical protein
MGGVNATRIVASVKDEKTFRDRVSFFISEAMGKPQSAIAGTIAAISAFIPVRSPFPTAIGTGFVDLRPEAFAKICHAVFTYAACIKTSTPTSISRLEA